MPLQSPLKLPAGHQHQREDDERHTEHGWLPTTQQGHAVWRVRENPTHIATELIGTEAACIHHDSDDHHDEGASVTPCSQAFTQLFMVFSVQLNMGKAWE